MQGGHLILLAVGLPFIRAERLEELVWGEVRRVLERPELIAAGLAALEPDEDGGLAGDIARTERELAGVQAEEDRAIRLFVTDKISEQQLDHQRRFIGERLERLRARLDEYRARESAQAGQRVALEQVEEWARSVGAGLDALSEEERRELLDLLLEDATIDGENRVTLTLAIPGDGEFVSIAKPEPTTPSTRCGRRHAGAGASARHRSWSSAWLTGTPSSRPSFRCDMAAAPMQTGDATVSEQSPIRDDRRDGPLPACTSGTGGSGCGRNSPPD